MPWVNVEDLPAPQPTPKEIDDVERYARQKKTRSRFYADENFPAGATEILREMGFDPVPVYIDDTVSPSENRIECIHNQRLITEFDNPGIGIGCNTWFMDHSINSICQFL